MKDSADFDAFYASSRERLLLQTYALSGDLTAAHAAVRDAFVVAWHHWRKVSRSADPEAWVRPVAWRNAQRRGAARVWHRERSKDPELLATLDALAKLPVQQRRILLLNHLVEGSMAMIAREAGLPQDVAERALQAGSAAYAVHRDVPSPLLGRTLEPLRAPVAAQRWPRATIVRRAGTSRRRTHTLAGAGVAIATMMIAGAASVGPVRPSLAGADTTSATPSSAAPVANPAPGAPAAELTAEHLLDPDQLGRLSPTRAWRVVRTGPNTEGNGLVVPCQQTRYADPRGLAALVREFSARPVKRRPTMDATQMTEVSRTATRARRAYDAMVGWFAGCAETHTQLVDVRTVAGVGDEAVLLDLRQWKDPDTSLVVGIARTGLVTTATVTTTQGQPVADQASSTLLAAAVNALCGAPGTGSCAAPPVLRHTELPPLGAAPGMLSTLDLPPVGGVSAAWAGTEPRKALENVAATQCDRADFTAAGMSHALTRSFVVPRGRLPLTFGITETVGTMPPRRAAAFVDVLLRRVARCEDEQLGTTVTELARRSTRDRELHGWRFDVEVSDQETVTVLMGLVRVGTAVGQVGFTPARGATLTPAQFLALLERAQARLDRMPGPERPKKLSKQPG